MAKESDSLLFTDFLSDFVVNMRLILPKINTFKQHHVRKHELVYITQ